MIDECHHAAAGSYEEIINYYAADIDSGKTDLLGLTATPDREDGSDILIIVGGSKVPGKVYKAADWNVSVTTQPHSEVSSLAIFPSLTAIPVIF